MHAKYLEAKQSGFHKFLAQYTEYLDKKCACSIFVGILPQRADIPVQVRKINLQMQNPHKKTNGNIFWDMLYQN